MPAEQLRASTTGRWRSILPALGLSGSFLTRKNGPCPFCGGKDRWRFIDRDGSGNWVCNQCGKGDGLNLAMRVLKTDFAKAALEVERVLGCVRDSKEPVLKPVSPETMRRIWIGAAQIKGTPGEKYFHRRGLEAPGCLRYSPKTWYSKTEFCRAVIAQVAGPEGRCVNLYRIFVDMDGNKAKMDRPKQMMRAPVPVGSAVRLCRAGIVLGLAEGIENALSATAMFGVPSWATVGTAFMEGFVIPEGVEELAIFADNDLNYAGQRAAYVLANRTVAVNKLRASVAVPNDPGLDWNDVLLARMGTTT